MRAHISRSFEHPLLDSDAIGMKEWRVIYVTLEHLWILKRHWWQCWARQTSCLAWWKPYPHILTAGRFKCPFSQPYPHVVICGLGWPRADSYSLWSSVYANDIPTPFRHVELAQYANDTALVVTSRSPSLLVGYLEAYLGRLEHLLRDGRIVINVSKSIAVLFFKTATCIRRPRPVQFLGEPMQCVETARHLGMTLDTQLSWSVHANQVGKKAAQRLGVLCPSLIVKGAWPSETVRCSSSSWFAQWWITHVRSGGPLLAAKSGSCKSCNSSVFALWLTHRGTLVTGKFTRIWGFHFRLPHEGTN
jgi:hypothetical protein